MNFYEKIKPTQIQDFIYDDEKHLRKLELLIKNKLTFPSPSKKIIIYTVNMELENLNSQNCFQS